MGKKPKLSTIERGFMGKEKQSKRFSFPRLMNEIFAFKEGEYKHVPSKYMKKYLEMNRNNRIVKMYKVDTKQGDFVKYIIIYDSKKYGYNGKIDDVVDILKINDFK